MKYFPVYDVRFPRMYGCNKYAREKEEEKGAMHAALLQEPVSNHDIAFLTSRNDSY